MLPGFSNWASDGQLMIDKGDGTYVVVDLVPNAQYDSMRGTWDWTFHQIIAGLLMNDGGDRSIQTMFQTAGFLLRTEFPLADPGNWTIPAALGMG